MFVNNILIILRVECRDYNKYDTVDRPCNADLNLPKIPNEDYFGGVTKPVCRK